MKLKFKENAIAVDVGLISRSSWVKSRNTKKKDRKCQECGILHEDQLGDMIALLQVKESMNKHLCLSCGTMYAELEGVNDVNKERIRLKNTKESLIKQIEDTGKIIPNWSKRLKDRTNDELIKLLELSLKEKAERERLEKISLTDEELKIEQYLINEYDVIHDSEYLKDEAQIEDYFKEYDVVGEYFDCGEGYCTNEITLIAKIGKRFYSVFIRADISSAKQDRGDRMFYFENVSDVQWEEVEKPKPKNRVKLNYEFDLNVDEADELKGYLKKKGWI